MDPNTVLASFEAKIGDRVINTKVTEIESAKEAYDDAVAGGKAAVMAQKTKKKQEETLTVKLGNLLPNQTASLTMRLVSQLEVVGGHFAFFLPMAFYPDYKKHGVKSKDAFLYEFCYHARIISSTRISNLSLPAGSVISEQNDEKTDITVNCSEATRSHDLFYRTADLMVPQLLFARSPATGKVAVSATLVPTFDPVQPQDVFEVVEDEKPEQVKLN